MERSINALRLAEYTLRGGADLKGSLGIGIDLGRRSINFDLKLNGNNTGPLFGAWSILHAMIEHKITNCTMDELIGALDILNELIDQTQPLIDQTQPKED